MFPAQRRDMGKQVCVDVFAVCDLISDYFTEFPHVPLDNDGGQQIEAGNAMLLPFGRAITYFAAPGRVYSPFQRVMSLALVQADLRPALQFDIA
nr:hypothetical protein [uncultured Cohaesibacter sp.]